MRSAKPAARRRRAALMVRFARFIERDGDLPVKLADVCRAIGTSERSLSLCCNEALGMPPAKFMVAVRLGRVRQALIDAGPDETVTEIATRFGFWNFGRMAVAYKAAFGEAPSETLQSARPPFSTGQT